MNGGRGWRAGLRGLGLRRFGLGGDGGGILLFRSRRVGLGRLLNCKVGKPYEGLKGL
jgi:hypothetical protein